MQLKAVKCPSCGADLQIPDDKDFIVCPYCSTTVQVREEVKLRYDANVSNLLKLADEDLKAGNYKEAYDYYNKALESDAGNPDAWLGKAVSSGFQSHSINEMMEWIGAAISNSSGEKQQSIKLKAASYINTIISGYDSTLNKASNMIPFINLSGGSADVYNSAISAMETAHVYSPANTEILHNLIKVCVHAKKYIWTDGLEDKIKRYQDELKQLDLNYNPASDMPQQPVIVSQTQNTVAAKTDDTSGCITKFLSIGLIIITVTVLAIGGIVFYVIHTVTSTVDDTKEKITKQIEPLKDLKSINKDVPKYENALEYDSKGYHVINVVISGNDVNTALKVNSYLLDSFGDKYAELIVNYFSSKITGLKFEEPLTEPLSTTLTEDELNSYPLAIMISSKSGSGFYEKNGTRYNKIKYK